MVEVTHFWAMVAYSEPDRAAGQLGRAWKRWTSEQCLASPRGGSVTGCETCSTSEHAVRDVSLSPMIDSTRRATKSARRKGICSPKSTTPPIAGRFRKFTREEIAKRGDNLDITWLKDDSVTDHADLPEPDVIAAEIVAKLQVALEEMQALQDELGGAS